jgi:hypothetical protein
MERAFDEQKSSQIRENRFEPPKGFDENSCSSNKSPSETQERVFDEQKHTLISSWAEKMLENRLEVFIEFEPGFYREEPDRIAFKKATTADHLAELRLQGDRLGLAGTVFSGVQSDRTTLDHWHASQGKAA